MVMALSSVLSRAIVGRSSRRLQLSYPRSTEREVRVVSDSLDSEKRRDTVISRKLLNFAHKISFLMTFQMLLD